MVARILLVFGLALAQAGCYTSEERGAYKAVELSPESRQGWEQWKREFLQLEDIKIGDGPVAAWGRKIAAEIEVRYVDGKERTIYRGPAIAYVGMRGSVFIHNGEAENGMLSLQQQGIILGLNGMAVGGKRRMVIAPNLVCYEGAVGESTTKGADSKVSCTLIRYYSKISGPIDVRKEKLIVEASLTASCIPVFIDIPYIYHGEFRCRNADGPQRDPGDPIWRAY